MEGMGLEDQWESVSKLLALLHSVSPVSVVWLQVGSQHLLCFDKGILLNLSAPFHHKFIK